MSGVGATLRCLFFMWGDNIDGLICRFMSVSVIRFCFQGFLFGRGLA